MPMQPKQLTPRRSSPTDTAPVADTRHSRWRASMECLRSSAAGCGVLAPAARAECGVSSGEAEFGDVAGAAERGLVWTRRCRGVVSGWGCQIRIVGSVHSLLVPRIKSLRTPNKSGL